MHVQIAETRPFLLLLLLFGPENKASHRERRGDAKRGERKRERERGSGIRKRKKKTEELDRVALRKMCREKGAKKVQ